MRKKLVKEGVFSSWENKYQQIRICLEICYRCMCNDPRRRPSASEIIQMLDETESTTYSGGSGNANAPLLWQVRKVECMKKMYFMHLLTVANVQLDEAFMSLLTVVHFFC
jgi:hypothetical protein